MGNLQAKTRKSIIRKTNLKNYTFFFCLFVLKSYFYVWDGERASNRVHLEVRGQLCGVNSFLPSPSIKLI